MLPTLRVARRFAASLALCGFILSHGHAATLAQAAPSFSPESPSTHEKALALQPSERLLAHHGGEGGTSGLSALSGTAAAGAAAAKPTIKGGVSQTVYSNSLWGNLLLSMAYQMDPDIQKIATRLGRANALALLSITGVSGLGLAQSIYAYNQILPQSINVTGAHGPGGHDHVHIPPDSKVPATLGIIGSGVTLATLGFSAATNKYYARQLFKKQLAVKTRVENILSRLRENAPAEEVQRDLTALVGPMASEEFLQLWSSAHR